MIFATHNLNFVFQVKSFHPSVNFQILKIQLFMNFIKKKEAEMCQSIIMFKNMTHAQTILFSVS
jgi:hypothetical protein